MTIASWGFAPALAAGNAVVLKPAELTPLTAMRLGELALEAGLPDGLFQVVHRLGLGRRAALRDAPRRAQGRVHRARPRSARDVAAGCAAQLKPRDARARRQERQHRLRRRRPRAGGGDGAGRGVRQRRPGLLRAQPHPGERCVFDRFLELLEPAVAGVAGGRSAPTRPPRWARSSRRRTATRVRSFVSTTRDVAFRGIGARRARLLVRADRVLRPPRDRVAQRGDLRPGRRGAAVRRRGRRDPARQRHDLRPRGLDLDREPRPRASASPAASKSGVLSVNSHSSVRYCDAVRRHEGVGPRPRARPRCRARTSPRPRTSSSPSTPVGRVARSASRPRTDHDPPEPPNPYDRSTMTDLTRIDLTQRLEGPRRRHHRRRERASGSPPRGGSRPRARRS